VTQTLSNIAYDDLRFNPPTPVRTLERPTASAGPDQQLHVGQTVELDGSASSDDNTDTVDLQFAWTFTSKPDGSLATLTAPESIHPSFIADLPGEYVVGLVVTDADGLASDMDAVIVSSNNTAPVADAGSAQGVIVGQLVTLDGSASHDADSDPLEFSWTLAAPVGSLAALAGATNPTATFIPDEPGNYIATLTVSDPSKGVSAATVTVSVITGQDYAATAILNALQTLRALRLDQVTTRGNRTAMQNFLVQALAALEAGDLAEASSKVAAAIERTDGCDLRQAPDGNGPERDWIVDCEAQAVVFDLLSAALAAITP
jgi:PKD repeat protein